MIGRSRTSPLRNRTVLITGGSRGLGLELAREAARRGARVAICARDAERLAAAANDVASLGAAVHAERCDVASTTEVRRAVERVEDALGPVDYVIAAAGVITVGPLAAQDREDVRTAMDIMFWGVVNTVDAVLPSMTARGRGAIAVVTSIGGRIAVPHLLSYTAAKFAATGFAEGLRAELKPSGITVTTVIPGLMRTGSHVNALFAGRPRAEYGWFSLSASLPLMSVPVTRAATIILDAVERGAPHVSVGWTAALAQRVHGVAPATTIRALSVVGRLLPNAGRRERRRGRRATSAVSESVLTLLGRRAARRQRQPLDAPEAAPASRP